MRGYFDGDGSWYNGSCRITPQLMFNLLGTKEFITTFRSILENNNVVPKREKDVRIKGKIAALEYGGNGLACKIRDFLYSGATVFLQRKFDKVKDVVTIKNK